ncbi:nucleolar transcription factor 1-like [Anopheles maculipalpis]|uniref:nucleolar transcription factor 1-like n=1 Tax=Anopheles maculipalpis TaxID=1496333 RepID=UPI002159431A|nr:nucleolar transcription factor 1-like [Anopheles maculipalpis]
MRKRSLSVAYERAPKMEQISKKFEGVLSEHENESESEEENDELDVGDTATDWPAADYKKLVEQLRTVLPRKDQRRYLNGLKKVDWDRVAFDGHSPEEIRAVTKKVLSKIRKHRTLAEMVEDIPQYVDKMLSSGKPKNPPSAYNLFVKEKFSNFRKKNSDLATSEVFKIVSQEFAALSQKKKQKYEAMAMQAKEAHKLQLEQYYKDNPDALQSKKSPKTPKERNRNTKKIPKTITPFALFKLDSKKVNAEITTTELRVLWNDLELKKKIKYIQLAFKTQTENIGNSLKLTKEEQRLLEQASGKPGMFPGSTSEYYLKHHAQHNPALTVHAWRKEKLREYKQLSKLRKLELEIEYRQAKQEYVNKYEAYIESIADETKRQAEIDLLRSFIQTKMDKHDRQHCEGRSFMSILNSSRDENDIMAYPIAESTILVSESKKAKRKTSKSAAQPKAEPEPEMTKKPLKSILKSTAAVTAVPKSTVQEFAVPEVLSSPKKKRKQSLSDHESDSSSTAEKKSKLSITLPHNEETDKKKSGAKQNGTKALPNEPIRPPTNTLQFYKENYYLGKPEQCEESFKKLSETRKAVIKQEMRAAHSKYFKQLQKFLKSVPQKNIELYLKKLKQAERDSNKGEESSSEEDESGNVSVAKGTPKQEPPETSSSSSSEDEDDAPEKNQNGQNKAEDDTEEDDDGCSSSDA